MQTEALIGYADWVCRTIHDKSKMLLPWYQYSISEMGAVTAAADALNKYLGQCFNIILVTRRQLQRI